MRRTSAVMGTRGVGSGVFAALAAIVVALSTTAVTGVAAAQTGYPPGACTPATSTQTLGSFNVGQAFTFNLTPICAWTAGAPVAVAVNGQSVGTKTASAGGSVSVTIRIVSANLLEVDDPVQVPAVCGTNTVTGVGPSNVANEIVTAVATFTLVCPTPTAQPVPTRGVALTGANVARMAAGALVLLVAGGALVTVFRRRKSPQAVA